MSSAAPAATDTSWYLRAGREPFSHLPALTSEFLSSLPGFFFNFLSQVPCIEARVWPQTEEDFINKKSLAWHPP